MNNIMIIVLTIFCLFYTAFANNTSKIYNEKNDNFLLVTNACVSMISRCSLKYMHNIIVLGDINNKIMQSIYRFNSSLIPLILQSKIHQHFNSIQLCKHSSVIIVVVTNQRELQDYLTTLKAGLLWSITQSFFIIDKLTDKNECRNVNDYLRLSWAYNLLHVFYLCLKDNRVLIWTFNPFINGAPNLWNFQHALEIDRYHLSIYWFVFHQDYQTNSYIDICESLYWDKTEKLNGVKAKSLILPNMKSYRRDNINVTECLKEYNETCIKTIFSHMNVTKVVNCVTTKQVGFINEIGHGNGSLGELVIGDYDLLVTPLMARLMAVNMTIKPLNFMSRIKFVVLQKDSVATVEKIMKYLGWRLILATATVTLITLMILRYFIEQSVSSLLLEMIRLLADMGIYKLPQALALRFYFGPVFIFYFMFQGIFQAHLSALLTISFPEKNLDTINDLKAHLDYKIYVPTIQAQFVNKNLKSRLIIVPELNCIKYIENNTKAVCIGSDSMLFDAIMSSNYHLSTESFFTSLQFFYTRNDWPIQRKFDKILYSLIESGLFDSCNKQIQKVGNKNSRLFYDLIDDNCFAPFKFNELAFAFQGLLIGLSVAAIIFFVEIKVWRFLSQLVDLIRK